MPERERARAPCPGCRGEVTARAPEASRAAARRPELRAGPSASSSRRGPGPGFARARAPRGKRRSRSPGAFGRAPRQQPGDRPRPGARDSPPPAPSPPPRPALTSPEAALGLRLPGDRGPRRLQAGRTDSLRGAAEPSRGSVAALPSALGTPRPSVPGM